MIVDDVMIKQIINIFSFTTDEMILADYLRDYNILIQDYLVNENFDELQLLRYMLIGFFVDYMAVKHAGGDFTTYLHQWKNLESRQRIKKKLEYFNSINGREIASTEEYLEFIKWGFVKKLTGKMLYNFVVFDMECQRRNKIAEFHRSQIADFR